MRRVKVLPAQPVDVGLMDNQTIVVNGQTCGYYAPCGFNNTVNL
jgi:hypothetical protein